MNISVNFLVLPLTALLVLPAASANAQGAPTRPIKIVTTEPGTGPDLISRLLSKPMSDALGQPVFVDNQAGANGILAAQAVARATPDGTTLLMYSGAIWTFPLIQTAPYDPVRDFAPVTIAASSPSMVVVTNSLPVSSVSELIAMAKAKPGQLNYASGGLGSPNHLAAEMFKSLAGVNLVRIAYKGGGAAESDLVAGHVQVTFSSGATLMPLVKAGKLKALAVTSAQRSALFPGLPTAAESGLKGYESVSRYNFFTTAKTPTATINRLNHDIVQSLNFSDVKTKLFETGTEVVGSTPEELAAVMRSDMEKMGKLIDSLGIRGQAQ